MIDSFLDIGVTTTSVVLSIFWCIIADALFSIIFYF